MKLILNEEGAIAGTGTDEYFGPNAWVVAPEDFDIERINEYRIVNGAAVIPVEVQTFEKALDTYFDQVAQSDRWDNRFTLMVRAGFPNKWREKAIAFGTWVDSCNEFAIDLLTQVTTGQAEPPASPEAFLAMLPPPPDMTSEALQGSHNPATM